MNNQLFKFCGLLVALFLFSNSALAQANIECRQPVSTVVTPGECGALDLIVLPPFLLNDFFDLDNVVITNDHVGDDYDAGTTVLEWTVTDGANVETCTSLVIVEDDELPVVGPCTTEISYTGYNCVAGVLIDSDISDNCGVLSVQGLGLFVMAPGLYEHPVTVTDVNGNVTVHIVTVQVHDDGAPEFINCPTSALNLVAGPSGTVNYPVPAPIATDNCGATTVTSNLPEGGLPTGENTVIFTASDDYGNLTHCEVTVNVAGGITAMHPASGVQSSLGENENTQIVSWNSLNANTVCTMCEETNLEGFRYVGTSWGHQYFLADEVSMTREEAQLIAEGYDAHLAVINDAAENAYLVEALDDEVRSAWIGLMPQYINETWTFAWDNGDASDFDATNISEINADTRIVLTGNGTWEAATNEEDKYFLIERPCVDIAQTGPIVQPDAEVPGVMLRSGDAWEAGEYEVTYTMTDMCGNTMTVDFPVDVLPEVAEYCTSAGADNGVWIEKVVFHDLVNETASNDGYADFTEENTIMNIGDGVVLLNLKAGGNEVENTLYWRVYMDTNNDGDFFDADEMIFEQASATEIQANLTLPVVSLDDARLRVVVSRYSFSEPCGDISVGEIEDYNVTLQVPELHERPIYDLASNGKKLTTILYPNPADTYVNVDLADFRGQSVIVRVFDNLGQLRLTQTIEESFGEQMTLNLEKLTSGMYQVAIFTQDFESVTKRLVVD